MVLNRATYEAGVRAALEQISDLPSPSDFDPEPHGTLGDKLIAAGTNGHEDAYRAVEALIPAATLQQRATLSMKKHSKIKQYIFNVLIAIDQLGNAILFGDPDETISSRAAKRAHKRGWRILARILEAVDSGHLRRAREDDEGKDAIF